MSTESRSTAVRSAAALLAAAFVAWLPAEAAAQPGPVSSPEVQITLSGGALVPLSTLVEDGEVTGENVEVSESTAFGGGLGVGLPGGLTIEAQGLFAPNAGLEGGITGEELSDGDILTVTGHLLYRIPIPVVQPFFGGGAGYKSLSFEDATALETDSESDFTGVALAGVFVGLGGVDIRAEVRDYISTFDDPGATDDANLQHDVAILAGLTFGFP